jgi:hypothetical protein
MTEVPVIVAVADVILEICNSLILIFLITEISRIRKSSSHSFPSSFSLSTILSLYSSVLLILTLWAFILFLHYNLLPIQSIILSFSPLTLFSGSWFFLSICFLLLLIAIFLCYFKYRNQPFDLLCFFRLAQPTSKSFLPQEKFILPLISLLALLLFSGILFLHSGVNHYVKWLSQISLVMISFITVLYLDIHRFRNDITIRKFLLGVLQAVLYSLGAIPILMILISFFFLILSSLLEALGRHPENSYFFNQLIYYGTLYGPFYIVYWNAKHRLLRSPYLP